MYLRIDSDKCQGHNRCYSLAPGLVDVDDYGSAFVRSDAPIPGPLVEAARLIVDNCPEYAIELVDEAPEPR